MKAIDKKTDKELYLEYINDFLTIQRMAEHYGVSRYFLNERIKKGRKEDNKVLT